MSGTEALERVNINIPPGASLQVSKSQYWRLSVCLKAESGESCGAYQDGWCSHGLPLTAPVTWKLMQTILTPHSEKNYNWNKAEILRCYKWFEDHYRSPVQQTIKYLARPESQHVSISFKIGLEWETECICFLILGRHGHHSTLGSVLFLYSFQEFNCF